MTDLTKFVMSTKFGRESTPRQWESVEREFERIYTALRLLVDQVNINTTDIDDGGGGGSGITQLTGDVTAGPGSGPQVATIANLAVSTAKLANLAVTTAKIALLAVQTAQLDNLAVTTAKIDALAVTTAKLDALAVTTAKIAANAVSNAKLDQMPALSAKVNATNALADPQDLAAAVDGYVLQRLGTALVWGLITSASTSGTFPAALHNLLSATHPDTVTASPDVGSMIAGIAATAVDTALYWFNGLPIDGIVTSLDPGGEVYWFDGLAWVDLGISTGSAVWQKTTPTATGQVPYFDGTQISWQTPQSTAIGASAYRTADADIAINTETALDLAAASFDSTSFWSGGTPSRLTIPTGQGGKYLVVAEITWDTATVGNMFARILVNGSAKAAETRSGVNTTTTVESQQVSGIFNLSAGDYLQLAAYWEIGGGAGTRRIKGGQTQVWISAIKLGV